ncbi:hypothetical protein BR63_17405 [Thermanaerosceptrum fracticalcis]|uniref:Uncharacterized protein n=1 Tax=Thermanaerosceptrum fracticalcis TaxID=1712410 RepID=A0A7G6E724_THEFR|nr:hypothetical protein [Thermanaerosceptrum fracticalcis]QNB47878.1 hypothetical protein BR63_17405 [Thermanaerosceptrum fracticalcis]
MFSGVYLQTLFRKVLREKEPKTSYYDIIKELARVAVVQLEIAKKKYLVRTEIRGLAAAWLLKLWVNKYRLML